MTPLHEAAAGGHIAVVELLLANKADVHAKAYNGDTPLHEVARLKEAVRRIVSNRLVEDKKRGTDVKLSDSQLGLEDVDAAFHEALACVHALIAAGAGVNARNDKGETPLMLVPLFDRRAEDCVRALIEAGADVNARMPGDNKGNSVLMAVVEAHCSIECVKALIAAGADVKAQDEFGKTAILIACKEGMGWENAEVIKSLISAGADPNVKPNTGDTALMYAILTGDPQCVMLLLEHGAQPNGKQPYWSDDYSWHEYLVANRRPQPGDPVVRRETSTIGRTTEVTTTYLVPAHTERVYDSRLTMHTDETPLDLVKKRILACALEHDRARARENSLGDGVWEGREKRMWRDRMLAASDMRQRYVTIERYLREHGAK